MLYDKPNGSKIVGKLSKGEFVEALTGEVHTKPILVSVIADHVDDSGNHFDKSRNCSWWAISPFIAMISTLLNEKLHILLIF